MQFGSVRVDVFHIYKYSASVLTQLHNRTDISRRGYYGCFYNRFGGCFNLVGRGEIGWVVNEYYPLVLYIKLVNNAGCGRDKVEVELTLQTLLDNLHMQ